MEASGGYPGISPFLKKSKERPPGAASVLSGLFCSLEKEEEKSKQERVAEPAVGSRPARKSGVPRRSTRD